jgi:hypothetical protein
MKGDIGFLLYSYYWFWYCGSAGCASEQEPATKKIPVKLDETTAPVFDNVILGRYFWGVLGICVEARKYLLSMTMA